jgi:prevent-host-death family protein
VFSPLDNTYAIWYYIAEVINMIAISVSKARQNLYKLIDQSASNHDPVQIIGKRNSAVLISSEDWSALQETVYLLSIPKMRESIIKGLKTPVKNCSRKLSW